MCQPTVALLHYLPFSAAFASIIASFKAFLMTWYSTRPTKRQIIAYMRMVIIASMVFTTSQVFLNGSNVASGSSRLTGRRVVITLFRIPDFMKLMMDMNSLPSMLTSSSSE